MDQLTDTQIGRMLANEMMLDYENWNVEWTGRVFTAPDGLRHYEMGVEEKGRPLLRCTYAYLDPQTVYRHTHFIFENLTRVED